MILGFSTVTFNLDLRKLLRPDVFTTVYGEWTPKTWSGRPGLDPYPWRRGAETGAEKQRAWIGLCVRASLAHLQTCIPTGAEAHSSMDDTALAGRVAMRRAGLRWQLVLLAAVSLPAASALVQDQLRGPRLAVRRPTQHQVAGAYALPRLKEIKALRGGEQLDEALGDTAHMKSVADVIKMAAVDVNQGLSSDEVLARREKYGLNQLPTKERVPLWKRFIAQFDDKMVHILLAAAGISVFFSMIDTHAEAHPFVEPMVIITILLLNACIGVWQESNAESAIEALSTYNPDQAKVLRNGQVILVDAKELVPGDVVEIAVGDKVPADVRLIQVQSTALKVEQAALTGEAASVNKNVAYVSQSSDEVLVQKENMMFAATDVVYGKCQGVVVRTGKATEIGKIAQALTETEDQDSPLKEKLDQFGELLTDVIKWICVACWLVNVPNCSKKGMALTGKTKADWNVWLKGAMHFFKIAVTLAVAAIPEGLPAVVTTCLALGTRRMAAKNALVRHLPAVETLGCTSVICSDKTGTLTTNQMSVQRVLLVGKDSKLVELEVEGITYEPKGRARRLDTQEAVTSADYVSLNEVSKVSSLCNQAGITKNDAGVWERIGESTEAALKVLAEKIGAAGQGSEGDTPANDHWASQLQRLAVLEFNRERKSMSVLVGNKGDEKGTLLVKGATEMVLQRCNKVRNTDGSTVPLTDAFRKEIIKFVEDKYASGKLALRCLAHAVLDKKLSALDPRLSDPKKFEDVESDLTFVGLTGILDPPREEVKGAIAACKQAGIRVVVITGDNPKTAETICRMIGVFEGQEKAEGKSFTGKEWMGMDLAQKRAAVRSARLFSRTEPIHKKEIVDLLQETEEEGGPGETCAMTGDGVNDAPALKAASIGVAMGSGTSVAQGAAKMVLADDNFITIVNAVEEGRAIYANTKAFIRYLISSNIGEVVCVFLAVLLGLPEVLSPVALLWVNLVTDGLPATALSFNPAEPGIMQRPPRRRNEQLVDSWMLARYLVTGAYVGIATVSGYIWWMCSNPAGPLMTFRQLRGNMSCPPGTKFANGFGCEVFNDKRPGTVALSVLVTIEMLNALNAVTETKSLFSLGPWANPWLILAVLGAFTQHYIVLSWKPAEIIFHVKRLTQAEWNHILKISAPIVVIEEIMKLFSRYRQFGHFGL